MAPRQDSPVRTPARARTACAMRVASPPAQDRLEHECGRVWVLWLAWQLYSWFSQNIPFGNSTLALSGADAPRHKSRKCAEIILYTGFLQRRHVGGPVVHANHRPWVSPGCQHEVHRKAGHTPIPIHIRMYETKQPVPEHGTDKRIRLFRKTFAQGFHSVAHIVEVRWSMMCTAQEHNVAPVSY